MPTQQETFDIVTRHLLTQNRKSCGLDMRGNPCCLYRSPDGCKCAVGHLIPDDQYDPSIEGNSVFLTAVQIIVRNEGHDLDLANRLQTVHDNNPPGHWPSNLMDVATANHLNPTIIKAVLTELGRANEIPYDLLKDTLHV